jgi:hypothetical protein
LSKDLEDYLWTDISSAPIDLAEGNSIRWTGSINPIAFAILGAGTIEANKGDTAMLKKIITLVLALALTFMAGCAGEASNTYAARTVIAAMGQPGGVYQLSGPVSIKLNVPGIIKATVTSPNMGILGGFLGLSFDFKGASGQPDNFIMHMKLLDTPLELGGMWETTAANKFRVTPDFGKLIPLIEELGGTATLTKQAFSGKVQTNGAIKGAFALGVKIALMGINISLDISGSYTGQPVVLNEGARVQSLDQPAIAPVNVTNYFRHLLEGAKPAAE